MSDIPPKPGRLPKSATEAEKQKRAAFMKERKRCQYKANSSKRKRAKSGHHGGHRDGAGRKLEDIVSSTIHISISTFSTYQISKSWQTYRPNQKDFQD